MVAVTIQRDISSARSAVWASVALVVCCLALLVAINAHAQVEGIQLVWRTDKYLLGFDLAAVLGLVFVVVGLCLLTVTRQENMPVTPTSVTVVLFLSLVLPGVIFASYSLTNGWIARLGFGAGFLSFAIGAVFIERALSSPKERAQPTPRLEIEELPSGTIPILLLLAVLLMVIVLISGLDRAGLFQVLSQLITGGFDYELTRTVAEERAAKYTGSRSYLGVIAEYAGFALLPIIGATLVAEGNRRSLFRYRFVGYLIVGIAVFAVIGSASRLQLGRMILYFGVLWMLLGKPSWKAIAGIGLAVVSLLASMTVLLGRMAGGDSVFVVAVMAVNRLVERALLTKGFVSSLVVDYFPRIESYMQGESILSKLLGLTQSGESVAEKLHLYLFGVPGTAGPQAFGDAYANYGPVAFVPCGLIVGMVVHGASLAMRGIRRTDILGAAVMGYAVLAMGYIGYSDLSAPRVMGLHIVIAFWASIVVGAAVWRRVIKVVFQ